MILLLILAFICGVVVDNLFAPKVKYTNGSLTFEWHNPKSKN